MRHVEIVVYTHLHMFHPKSSLNMILKFQRFLVCHLYSRELLGFSAFWPVLDAFHAASFDAS